MPKNFKFETFDIGEFLVFSVPDLMLILLYPILASMVVGNLISGLNLRVMTKKNHLFIHPKS